MSTLKIMIGMKITLNKRGMVNIESLIVKNVY